MKELALEPLTLEHQQIFSTIWQPLAVEHTLCFAEYSFANNFMFRRQHHYEVVLGDPPILQGRFKDNTFFWIPTLPPQELAKRAEELLPKGCYCFYPIPQKWLPFFPESDFVVQSHREDSDYLYHVEKIRTLEGRALSSRRNLLHQLESRFTLTSQPLDKTSIPQALELLETWQEQTKEAKEGTDYFPCRDALENFERLALFGRLAFGDGQPIGFTIGEIINPITAFLHSSKGRLDIKGATPYLYSDFALHLPEEVQWINFEQDLGLESLRQAKSAYQPDKLLEKWRVCKRC